MQQPANLLPHFKTYLKDNWDTYKVYTASKLKPLIATHCQPLMADEDSKFAKWFEDQKTYEKRKAKKQQNSGLTKDSSIIASSSATNTNIQLDTKSISDGVTDLMLEEKKQDQNLELFLNDEGQLIQNLLQWTTEEEKLSFLRSQLQSNFLVLNKFMRSRREAPQGFLELVLTLCKELEIEEQHKQSILFIRICALHQKEQLEVTKDLIKNALVELAYKASDEQAAYGLLKLSYLNNISFKTFPLDSLNRFQERYQMPLKRFLLYLEGSVDYKPLKCLPLTCFIFTHPFYNLLKDSGALLHRNIDPDYQIQFVELLAHSFEGQEEHVSDFIDIFSRGCIQIYGRGIQLLPLLERIIQKEQTKDLMFFGSLKHQNTLFKHLFQQLEEERISKLDEETINELLEVNEEQYLRTSKQPRVINTHEEAEQRLLAYWQQFVQCNAENIPSTFNPTVPGCPSLAKLLSLFKIKCLTPTQMISFQMMHEQLKQKRIFQRFSTGTGKTTLSLIWMLYSLVQFKIKSISCYESEELCENDYSKLYKEAATLYPSVALVSKEEHLQTFIGADIIFVTTSFLQRLIRHELMEHTFQQFQLVLDEFDAVLFDNQNNQQIVELFLKFNYFVAFTGSPLEIVHKNTIAKHLGGMILTYPSLEALEGKDNICKGKEVYDKRPAQVEAIVGLCEAQTLSTPVLVILDESGQSALSKGMIKNKLPLINLAESTPTDIISLLSSSVTVPQNGRYNTFILSKKQGRGLDVPTSSAIEKAGGVYVVIAVLPKTFRETEQFKGRTRRMGGKGQYSIILWEKTKGQTAETFLQQRLEASSMEELQRLAIQYASIKSLPLSHNYEARQADPKEEIKQSIEVEAAKKNEIGDSDMIDEQINTSSLQGQATMQTVRDEENDNDSVETKANETQKPLWQSKAEHIQETKALKKFAPQIQKECIYKQPLLPVPKDLQVIGQKRVKNGTPLGLMTDSEDNMEESKEKGGTEEFDNKRTKKAKTKGLNIQSKSTSNTRSKRNKKEKTIREEGMEGNSQENNSTHLQL